MKLTRCYFVNGKKVILIQGLAHISAKNIYTFLNTMENWCAKRGYLVVREGIEIDPPRKNELGKIDEDHEVLGIACALIKTFGGYKEGAKYGMSFAEHSGLPIMNTHAVIDVKISEYARRLYEAGMRIDYEVMRFLIKHEVIGNWAKSKEQYELHATGQIRAKLKDFGSWEGLLDRITESLNCLRILEAPLVWRETRIIERLWEVMNEREKEKALLFYGDHHIAGFRNLLLEKGWTEVYSKNLKPRIFT